MTLQDVKSLHTASVKELTSETSCLQVISFAGMWEDDPVEYNGMMLPFTPTKASLVHSMATCTIRALEYEITWLPDD